MKKLLNIVAALLLLIASTGLQSVSMRQNKTIQKPSTSAPANQASQGLDLVTANNNYKQAAANQKKAKTPAEKAAAAKEKAAARKILIQAATDVLKASQLSTQRNLLGELRGYQDEEAEAAEDSLIDLQVKQTLLKKAVDALTIKKDKLENKGLLWNSIKTGKEEQHAKITAKLNELEPTLKELDAEIREQSIIAGKQNFTKTRAFALACLASVMTGATLYAYYGPATSKAALLAFKNDPKGYALNALTSFKNMVAGWFGSSAKTAISEQMLNSTADGLSKSLEDPGFIAQFGKSVYEMTKGTAELVRDSAAQIIISAAAAKVVTKLYDAMLALEKLIADPKATPEQVAAQNKKVQTLAQQVKQTPQTQKTPPTQPVQK